MHELSLCSGAGLGCLATQHLLGFRAVGYVEIDDYCQRVLAARIADGFLDRAPIFGDIRAFLGDGYAERYRGLAEVITAGFPCQPFSFAGRRRGAADDRNLWPAVFECIRVARPRWVLLENNPGLLYGPAGRLEVLRRAHGLFARGGWCADLVDIRLPPYAGRVVGDLAASGYDVRWLCLSAAACGAPHLRDRVWIAARYSEVCERGAYPDANRGALWEEHVAERRGQTAAEPRHHGVLGRTGARDALSDSDRLGRNGRAVLQKTSIAPGIARPRGEHPSLPDTDGGRCLETGPGRLEPAQGRGQARPRPWWAAEPAVGRVAHGVPDRVAQLKALGNGQVPVVAARAWGRLMESWEVSA